MDRMTHAEPLSAAVEMARRIADAMEDTWRRQYVGYRGDMHARDLPDDLRADVMPYCYHVRLWVWHWERGGPYGHVELLLVIAADGSAAVIEPRSDILCDGTRWRGLLVYDPEEVEQWQADPRRRNQVPGWWPEASECIARHGAVTGQSRRDDPWE